MKSSRLLPLLAAAMLAMAAPRAQAQSEPFRIVNRTPLIATSLNAVRSGREGWGGNLLNRGPLGPGGQFSLRPAEGTGCRFDLRMVLQDGQEVVRRNADICAERTVMMTLPPVALAPCGAPGFMISVCWTPSPGWNRLNMKFCRPTPPTYKMAVDWNGFKTGKPMPLAPIQSIHCRPI